MHDLPAWLAHAQHLHDSAVSSGALRPHRPLDALRALAQRLGITFTCPVITVGGTNGKGSTCALLEAIATQAGYRVGLFTSPHLVHFQERCRIQGEPVAADALVPHMEAVEAQRQGQALSWFEYTTLAILRALAQAELDVVVLEVGLGGRLDAVNLVDADCAVLTSIDLDHTAILGPDRERIGWEKSHIMRPGKPAIIGDPLPPQSVLQHGQAIGADLWLVGRDFNHSGDRQQWAWSGRGKRMAGMAFPALRGANQLLNASAALAALQALRERLPVSAQAVRTGLAVVNLPGRFQIVPGQPVIVLDVAHNPQAVAALAVNLDAMGYHPRTLAVWGAMADKDLSTYLPRLLPLIQEWHCCGLPSARAASAQSLVERVQQAGSQAKPGSQPVASFAHPDPASALAAAVASAGPADRIVIFGSFMTVGAVLAAGLPRSHTAHSP